MNRTDLSKLLRTPKITHHQISRDGEPYRTVEQVHPIDSLRLEAAGALESAGEPVACTHRIADATNKHVQSGYYCVDCGALFAAAVVQEPLK